MGQRQSHYGDRDGLNLGGLDETGLSAGELERVIELAEHPELENYDVAHARG